jgi:hypothetical protein
VPTPTHACLRVGLTLATVTACGLTLVAAPAAAVSDSKSSGSKSSGSKSSGSKSSASSKWAKINKIKQWAGDHLLHRHQDHDPDVDTSQTRAGRVGTEQWYQFKRGLGYARANAEELYERVRQTPGANVQVLEVHNPHNMFGVPTARKVTLEHVDGTVYRTEPHGGRSDRASRDKNWSFVPGGFEQDFDVLEWSPVPTAAQPVQSQPVQSQPTRS